MVELSADEREIKTKREEGMLGRRERGREGERERERERELAPSGRRRRRFRDRCP